MIENRQEARKPSVRADLNLNRDGRGKGTRLSDRGSEKEMSLSVDTADDVDAAAVAALRTAVADQMTRQFGRGHWSAGATTTSALRGIATSRVLVARDRHAMIGTLRLATKKPWAIDVSYFERVKRPLYLIDMAVEPGRQRQGVGRYLIEAAKEIAVASPADAIRLDAYDGRAGAGTFYAKCGFREVGRVIYRGVPLIYFEWIP
jgi:GNAT superfamily N-acetyltransferase